MRTPLALSALTLLAALTGAPRPADACGNEVERVVDVTNQSVRRAESLLAGGKHQRAAKEILATFPEALRADRRHARQNLFDRGQRVLALAVVRSDGAIKLGRDLPGKTEAEREINLAWAAGTLRLHAARGDGSVLLASELAEALARRPAERHEAHALLRELADGDVMPTVTGWVVLAKLEKARGDAGAAARAIARCKELAREPGVCPGLDNA